MSCDFFSILFIFYPLDVKIIRKLQLESGVYETGKGEGYQTMDDI